MALHHVRDDHSETPNRVGTRSDSWQLNMRLLSNTRRAMSRWRFTLGDWHTMYPHLLAGDLDKSNGGIKGKLRSV